MFTFLLRDSVYINLYKFMYIVYKHFNIIIILYYNRETAWSPELCVEYPIQFYLPQRDSVK